MICMLSKQERIETFITDNITRTLENCSFLLLWYKGMHFIGIGQTNDL